MNDNEELDISKVVSLILENPQLIEQISNLARKKDQTESTEAITPPIESTESKEETKAVSQATYTPHALNRSNRSQLFCALKPYVSNERAKAIDSMMAIADVLDMMKAR